MDTFFARTTAIADAGEALVRAAHAAGYSYPFPFNIGTDAGDDATTTLTMQGYSTFTCLNRYQVPTQPVATSVHTRMAIEAPAARLALALEDLECTLRAIPGWAGGDVLGLYTRLSFRCDKDRPAGSVPTVFGTLCLELATTCPILGHKASNVEDPFRDTCDRLGRMLDHVHQRTRHWDRDNLCTWHVRDMRTSPSNGPTPAREVFAPTQADALEADSWWHFQAPLYAVAERLPVRTATCMSRPACSCSQREAS
jgi:hypothetical protein